MSNKEEPAHDSAARAQARTVPTIRELTADQSRALLARNHVGRIAFTIDDRVDIHPILYVSDENWLYGRTNHGSKFATLARHAWCAFEVDEVRGVFDWDSVVVKGHMELLDPELGSPDSYARGLELMRSLVAGTFTEADPAPQRSILFRLHVSELTGRTARVGP